MRSAHENLIRLPGEPAGVYRPQVNKIGARIPDRRFLTSQPLRTGKFYRSGRAMNAK